MSDAIGIVASLLLVAILVVAVALGRKFSYGERKGWPQIRRDLFSGTLDEGIYPLDPPPDGDADRVNSRRD